MRMPKYEKLRNKQLFQIMPRKKSASIWVILNSSIVIWLLTVVVGSAFSFTLTNLQACLKDAESKALRANKVYAEILDRRVSILQAIKDAKGIADLAERMKSIGFVRYEFKDVPLVSLSAELREFQMITLKLSWAEAWGRHAMALAGLTEDDRQYLEILGEPDLSGRPHDYFKGLKTALPKLSAYVNTEIAFAARFAVVPYCTVSEAFTSMWRSRDRVLEFKEFDEPREAPYVPLPAKGAGN